MDRMLKLIEEFAESQAEELESGRTWPSHRSVLKIRADITAILDAQQALADAVRWLVQTDGSFDISADVLNGIDDSLAALEEVMEGVA